MKDESQFATKADIEALRLEMRAGFQLCMERMQIMLGQLRTPEGILSKEQIAGIALKYRPHFDRQLALATLQILDREKQE